MENTVQPNIETTIEIEQRRPEITHAIVDKRKDVGDLSRYMSYFHSEEEAQKHFLNYYIASTDNFEVIDLIKARQEEQESNNS